jgi:hypothetical protein
LLVLLFEKELKINVRCEKPDTTVSFARVTSLVEGFIAGVQLPITLSQLVTRFKLLKK